MAKQLAHFLPSTRVDPALKDEFFRAASEKGQSPSEAMREAALQYIRRAKQQRVRDQAARIRANTQDEADVMNWIAAHSALGDDD